MFLHEFREDFVLALELLLQEGNPLILGVGGSSGAGLDGGGAVLEELLLPAVEHRGMDPVLVTQVRNGGVFEEMEPKKGDLLLSREAIPDFLGHGRTSTRDCSLFEQTVCPISTEAKHIEVKPEKITALVNISTAMRPLFHFTKERVRTTFLSRLCLKIGRMYTIRSGLVREFTGLLRKAVHA
jgi:hypothetical protein